MAPHGGARVGRPRADDAGRPRRASRRRSAATARRPALERRSRDTRVPRVMSPELAELVGYFMGDGSLHAKGLRLCVDRRGRRGRREAHGTRRRPLRPRRAHPPMRGLHRGRASTRFPSRSGGRPAGLPSTPPFEGHRGKGWAPHVPDAVLHSNDPRRSTQRSYADSSRPTATRTTATHTGRTTNEDFSRDVQTLMLTLGFITTRYLDTARDKLGGPCHRAPPSQRIVRVAFRGGGRLHRRCARTPLCATHDHPSSGTLRPRALSAAH